MTVASELNNTQIPEDESMIESELHLGEPKIADLPTGVTGAKPNQESNE